MKTLLFFVLFMAQAFALNQTFNGNVVITGNLTVGGSLAVTGSFSPSGAILAPNGSALAPSYSFASDTDLGVYRIGPNEIGFSAGNSLKLSLSGTVISLTNAQVQNENGSVGAPSYSFIGDSNTGFYRVGADHVAIVTGGAAALQFTATTVNPALQIVQEFADSAGSPGYSWGGDTNTGMFHVGADSLGLSTGGTVRLTVASSSVSFNTQGLFDPGSVGAPGVSFVGDIDTGLYHPGANHLALATNGVTAMQWTTTGVHPSLQMITEFADSAATPGYSWSGDNNTGMYRVGADNIGFSTGGTLRLDVGSAAVTSAVKVISTVSSFQGKVDISDTANPPTNAEVIAAFGAAATTGAGFFAFMDDNNAHTDEVFVWSDGTKYWYVSGTAAP